MSRVAESVRGWGPVQDVRTIPAFVRRDFLVAWSYRMAFFSDWLNLFLQVALFYFIGRIVDPQSLPSFGGRTPTYVEFVAAGIVVTSFLQIGLSRVATAMRNEQLMGTLESLLLTPASPTAIQLGSVAYDLLYVPVRTAIFLIITATLLGARFELAGAVPALLVIMLFVPVVWGLGMICAAGVLTFRRGLGVVGLLTVLLTGTSTTYFPAEVLPGWLRPIAELNPVTVTLDAFRDALLGSAGLVDIAEPAAILLLTSVGVLAGGIVAFGLALARERRRGTLGLY